MKKKIRWTVAILASVIGIIFVSLNLIYETSEDFYGFPLPKKAELVQAFDQTKSYNWSRASEENGIPLDYEIILKINGWKKGEREGASVLYTKGNHTIDLASYHKALDVIKR